MKSKRLRLIKYRDGCVEFVRPGPWIVVWDWLAIGRTLIAESARGPHEHQAPTRAREAALYTLLAKDYVR